MLGYIFCIHQRMRHTQVRCEARDGNSDSGNNSWHYQILLLLARAHLAQVDPALCCATLEEHNSLFTSCTVQLCVSLLSHGGYSGGEPVQRQMLCRWLLYTKLYPYTKHPNELEAHGSGYRASRWLYCTALWCAKMPAGMNENRHPSLLGNFKCHHEWPSFMLHRTSSKHLLPSSQGNILFISQLLCEAVTVRLLQAGQKTASGERKLGCSSAMDSEHVHMSSIV